MKTGNPIDEFQVIYFVTTAKPKMKISASARILSESERKKPRPISSFLVNAFYYFWKNREYTQQLVPQSAIYMKTPNPAILAATKPCHLTSYGIIRLSQ
jgi:hypothetical protein